MDSSTEDYVLDKECYISTEYSTALTDYLCQCEKKLQDKELNEQLPCLLYTSPSPRDS